MNKKPEEILGPYIEKVGRRTKVVSEENAIKAMVEFAKQSKETTVNVELKWDDVIENFNVKTNQVIAAALRKKPIIYIAGKVTGLPMPEVVAKFEAAEQKLIQEGYEVVNPLKVVDNFEATWNDAMRSCIKALMDCDEIFLLPDWGDSKGAKVEYALAYNLKMKARIDVSEIKDGFK